MKRQPNKQTEWKRRVLSLIVVLPVFLLLVSNAWARSPLGRPSYGLNDGSNSSPSIKFEKRIGKYFVSFMGFVVSSRVNERWLLKLYAVNPDTKKPFQGRVSFSIRRDSLFSSKEKRLGTQATGDHIFRQGVIFKKEGNYIVKAFFKDNGESYKIEMPLRVGSSLPLIPMVLSVVTLIIVSVGVVGLQIGKHRHARIRKRHIRNTVERVVSD